MELKESSKREEESSAKAVQVGALAPGINVRIVSPVLRKYDVFKL